MFVYVAYLPCPYDDFHGAPACSGALATQMSEDLSQASLIQEQAAICAAFARVMKYSGLLEETRGKLWRECVCWRSCGKVFSTNGARAIERCHRRDHQPIFRLDDQSFLCHASRIQETDIEERDKLKDYVGTLCTPLFTNADKAIARISPELFDVATIQQTTPAQNVETTNLGPRIQNPSPVDPVTLNVNTPEIAPDTAAGLPASSAPEVAPAENAQTGDDKDTSALFSAAQDDENIAILIDENMTLRAQVEILEKDLLAASEALDNVLTARTVITTDEAGNSLETALPEEDVVIEEADDLTPEAANHQALVYRPVTTTDDQIAEPQQPAIDVTLPAYENTMEPEGFAGRQHAGPAGILYKHGKSPAWHSHAGTGNP